MPFTHKKFTFLSKMKGIEWDNHHNDNVSLIKCAATSYGVQDKYLPKCTNECLKKDLGNINIKHFIVRHRQISEVKPTCYFYCLYKYSSGTHMAHLLCESVSHLNLHMSL